MTSKKWIEYNSIVSIQTLVSCKKWIEQNSIESIAKLNVYRKVLLEVSEKFNGAEVYIRERIEELCRESKLSAEEVTYLFMSDYNNF